LSGARHRVRKQDYEYNFAISGARCSRLTEGSSAQLPSLLAVMRREPSRWRRGVVVIRIGINDLGTLEPMEHFARHGLDDGAARLVDDCAGAVRRAVMGVRNEHPDVRLVLVGVLNNADWPRWHWRWRSRGELSNIERVLDAYDASLRSLAAAEAKVAFLDDRAWFRDKWGGRGAGGAPEYRAVTLEAGPAVSMAEGDDPRNAVLRDGHAGTVWNGLWASALVNTLNAAFGERIPEIAEDEVAMLAFGASGAPTR
jgi:hypothetical protein